MPFEKGNQYGKEHRWKKGGPSPNPSGSKGTRRSLLNCVEKVCKEEVEVELATGKIRMTNLEAIARRFVEHLKRSNPLDVTAFKLLLEHLDGKPVERDDASKRTPEDSAILIKLALDKMDAADGVDEPLDTEERARGAHRKVVADAKAPRRARVSAKSKAVQHRPRRKTKLQNRGRKKATRKKGPS